VSVTKQDSCAPIVRFHTTQVKRDSEEVEKSTLRDPIFRYQKIRSSIPDKVGRIYTPTWTLRGELHTP
jgi:hypothetical protein